MPPIYFILFGKKTSVHLYIIGFQRSWLTIIFNFKVLMVWIGMGFGHRLVPGGHSCKALLHVRQIRICCWFLTLVVNIGDVPHLYQRNVCEPMGYVHMCHSLCLKYYLFIWLICFCICPFKSWNLNVMLWFPIQTGLWMRGHPGCKGIVPDQEPGNNPLQVDYREYAHTHIQEMYHLAQCTI